MAVLVGFTVVDKEGNQGIILSYVKENGRLKGFMVNFYDPHRNCYYKQYSSYVDLHLVKESEIDHSETHLDSESLNDLRYINRILAVRTNDRSWYEDQFR